MQEEYSCNNVFLKKNVRCTIKCGKKRYVNKCICKTDRKTQIQTCLWKVDTIPDCLLNPTTTTLTTTITTTTTTTIFVAPTCEPLLNHELYTCTTPENDDKTKCEYRCPDTDSGKGKISRTQCKCKKNNVCDWKRYQVPACFEVKTTTSTTTGLISTTTQVATTSGSIASHICPDFFLQEEWTCNKSPFTSNTKCKITCPGDVKRRQKTCKCEQINNQEVCDWNRDVIPPCHEEQASLARSRSSPTCRPLPNADNWDCSTLFLGKNTICHTQCDGGFTFQKKCKCHDEGDCFWTGGYRDPCAKRNERIRLLLEKYN